MKEMKKAASQQPEPEYSSDSIIPPRVLMEKLNSMFTASKKQKKIIRLVGYSDFNKETDERKRYQAAKMPCMKKWQNLDEPGFSWMDADQWMIQGGWIGLVIPDGYDVIDIDTEQEGKLIYEALLAEGYNFHAIKTPKGYQFFFKSTGKIKGQDAVFLMAGGFVGDCRLAGRGQVVLPNNNTLGRGWIRIAEGELSYMPVFFERLKKIDKEGRPFPIPCQEGIDGRNNSLHSHACRLVEMGYSQEQIKEIAYFLNKHFFLPPLDEDEVERTLESAFSHQPSGKNYQEGSSIYIGHEEWKQPVWFDEHLLPPFPTRIFPEWLKDYVEGVAEATQTPVDLSAMLALSVMATAAAKKFQINPYDGWKEPLNLYTLTALPPGNRKSAVFSEMVKPIEIFESQEIERMRPQIAAANTETEIKKQRIKSLMQDAAKSKDENKRNQAEEEAKILSEELAKIPALYEPKYIVDDITPERLIGLMVENDGKLSIMSAEGGIFGMMAGRYSTNGQPNIDAFLKGHAGDRLSVDRMGRSEIIENPTLTLGLAVQPDIINGLTDHPGFRGRGLLGRFLYSIPKSYLGNRKIRPRPVTAAVKNTYLLNIKKVLEMKWNTNDKGRRIPYTLTLSPEAEQSIIDFAARVEPMLSPEGGLSEIADWAGKHVGQIARIAGLLHIAKYVQGNIPSQVDQDTMEAAISLSDYLIAHAKASFGDMGIDESMADQKYLVELLQSKVQTGNDKPLVKQDIWQWAKGRFKKSKRLDEVLQDLTERGYLRDMVYERLGKGRNQTFYFINPLSYKDYKSPELAQTKSSVIPTKGISSISSIQKSFDQVVQESSNDKPSAISSISSISRTDEEDVII